MFTIFGEVFPLSVKTQFTSIGMLTFYLLMVFITIIYPLVQPVVNYCIYLAFVVIPGIVLLVVLPETKGKTLDEIEELMIGKMENTRKDVVIIENCTIE